MTLTDSDKDLLLKAMCCVVAADGRVSGREITVIAEALTKAGFPTSPEQIRPAVIELSKTIHEKGTSLYARDLAARLFVSCDRDVATALLESLDALVNADGRATKRESEIERTFRAATHGVLATLSSPKYCRATYHPAGQPNGQWLGQALGACIGGCVAFLIVYAFSSHGASQQEAGLKALHSRSNAAQAAADHAMAAYTTQPNDRTLNELNNATTEAARSAIRFVDAAKEPRDISSGGGGFVISVVSTAAIAVLGAVAAFMCSSRKSLSSLPQIGQRRTIVAAASSGSGAGDFEVKMPDRRPLYIAGAVTRRLLATVPPPLAAVVRPFLIAVGVGVVAHAWWDSMGGGVFSSVTPADEDRDSVTMRPAETATPSLEKASAVESLLLGGRWTKRDGLSRGVIWQFDAGGKVLVTDGGNVDESYRWEVLARDEGSRCITIKYWSTTDPPNDFREWKLTFGPDGKSAMLENWRNKNGVRDLRGESPVYLVP